MKGIQKRIITELDTYYCGDYTFVEDNIYSVDIILDNNYLININYPKDYPFKSPQLYIKKSDNSKKEYINSFFNFRIRNTDIMKKYNLCKDWCPCCLTLSCIWSPGNNIHDLINEFLCFENIKNIIVNSYIICKANLFNKNIEGYVLSFLQY